MNDINLPVAVSIPIIVMSIVIVIAVTLGIVLRNAYHDLSRPPITFKFSVENNIGKLADCLEVFKVRRFSNYYNNR